MAFGLGGLVKSVLGVGSGTDAGSDAAQVQAQSNERAIAEQRRQYDETASRLLPFYNSGMEDLGAVRAAGTAGGLNRRVMDLMNTDTFGSLVDERTRQVNNYLSQHGLTQSGAALKEAAAIPTDLALQLENQLYGRQANNVSNAQNAAAGLGSIGAQTSGNISSLYSATGQALGQGIIGDQQARAAQQGQLLNLAGSALGAFAFSDPRLKKNIRPIGKKNGPSGSLTLIEWDWIDEVPDEVAHMNIGFNADEVSDKYPHRVVMIDGYKAIDYEGLTHDLKEAA